MRFAAPRTHPCNDYDAIRISALQNTKGEPIDPEKIQTLPFVTTSLRHHFPSSPLPFVTTSLSHRFP